MTAIPDSTAADPQQIIADLERRLDERTFERDESRQQQKATAEVLKVISSSAFDLQAVFETVVESSAGLARADRTRAFIYRLDGELLRLAAAFNAPRELKEFVEQNPVRPGRHSGAARAALERRTIHIPDVLADPEYTFGAKNVETFRTLLAVPILKGDDLLGVLLLYLLTVAPFTERQIAQVEAFADQAAIAIENARLFDEVQAKTRDLEESLQQQTATAEVLKAISRSAFDLESVLQTLVESARRLSSTDAANIYLRDGDVLRVRVHTGMTEEFHKFLQERPAKAERGRFVGRAFLTAEIVHLPDVLADSEYSFAGAPQLGDYRAVLGVPMVRNGRVEGVFGLGRSTPGPFTAREIELVRTFADQALIAIENARLFDEVQAKTRDLSESLQQQTATADVLKVISRSAFNLQTVLKTLVESALELCNAPQGLFLLRDGDSYRFAMQVGLTEEFEEYLSNNPFPMDRTSGAGRAALTGQVSHIHDVFSDPDYRFSEGSRLGGYRSLLSVPLLREQEVIGVFSLGRTEPEPFTERQIELVRTFADQAVIAIENARLFNETKESLERQTATADILNVIASSPTDTQPVFDVIARSATELCEGMNSGVYLLQDDLIHVAGHYNVSPEQLALAQTAFPTPPHRGIMSGRAILDRAVAHVPDIAADPEYTAGSIIKAGFRSVIAVPMLRNGEPIGAINVTREEARPFSDRQIALLRTFADQAVIAIENVRLFDEVQDKTRELTEALRYQIGSSKILSVIASSPTDVGPVLNAVAESACEFCEAYDAVVVLKEGGDLVSSAHHGPIPMNQARWPNDRNAVSGRVVADRLTVHLRDALSDEGSEFPTVQEMARLNGFRSILGVPMILNDEAVGAILLRRNEVQPFNDKQISLLQTFADQAVIAIQNARLFDEVQKRTRELSASLDELRTTQDRLIQTEKLASLGQLTAGIAHEIKNPLNFVNNFSALSAELTDELNDVLKPVALDRKVREELEELTRLLKNNLEKVVQHGKRADSIVKNMLLHSREGSGEHRPTDVNALLDESLNLAYHGARAEKSEFNITLQKDFDDKAGMIEVFPQEITRAFLNFISNGFYAAVKRKAENGNSDFEPVLRVTTRDMGQSVEIRVRDNGTGVPTEVREKLFNPFFTTKPAGEGTGLGLSMSHDIIVKQHGGRIEVDTQPGQFTEFIITLPRATIGQKAAGGTS